MQQKKVSFTFHVFDRLAEMQDEDQELMKRAIEAKADAYAPYSKFKVGAAVKLANGKIITGNNQENASYPSGLCAERVAVFHAKAKHPESAISTIAISASDGSLAITKPAAPCGNCRQALAEYEQHQTKPIRLLLQGAEGPVYECGAIADLLPLSFDSSYLNKATDE